ncbi:MAG: hypothetical protein QXL27_04450 [Candidatus Bathyarchaeia archaeon]
MNMSMAYVGDDVTKVRVSKWMAKLGWLQIPKEIRRESGLVKVRIGGDVYEGRLDNRGRLFCKRFKGFLREGLIVEVKLHEEGYDVSPASEQAVQETQAFKESAVVEQIKVEEKHYLKCPSCHKVLYLTDSEFNKHLDECKREKYENAKELLEKLKTEKGFREGSKIFLREHGELVEVSEQEAIEYIIRENNIHRLVIENPPFPVLKMEIDAKLFMDFLKLVNEFGDEVVFKATYSGLSVRMMNPSHVMLIDATISMQIMDKYELTDEFNITLNIEEVLKSFKPRKGDKLTLTAGRLERVKISCGNVARKFEQPDIQLDELPPLKVDFAASFTAPANEIYRIMSSLADEYTIKISVDDSVWFKGRNGEGVLDSQGLLDKSGRAEGSYSISYLLDVFKHIRNVARIVKVEFAENKPMRITAMEPVNVTVYIAPYVE